MAVIVKGLTKYFGEQKAIDDLNFSVQKGEILGFLGPNGAGKSTTMKILTGFLRQDEGHAEINGTDTREESLQLKRIVGYLPEHNPLYMEMYVREYLHFMASLYPFGSKAERIEGVIEETGLGREAHKKIGMLSKGYRQRVGLAQALIHNPEVIILDEPTSGLDPNQLVEIRALIKALGRDKTIIFSTHILQEVQAICDRVIIIHQGKLVLDRPIGFLEDFSGSEERIKVTFSRRVLMPSLEKVEGVKTVREGEHGHYTIVGDGKSDLGERIFDFAVQSGVKIREMRSEKSSVEDVFQTLTKIHQQV